MKNVVLLAPYFLPRRRVGSWRPFKFAIHLREFGWQPHVLTIGASGTLTRKERRLLKHVKVHQISTPFDRTGSSGSQLTASSSDSSRSVMKPALDWIDKQFPVDTWLPLFWLGTQRVVNFVKQISPEILWSTGDPWSSHWMGRSIKRKLGLPWVADFRDPWTLGKINLKKRSAFSSAIDRRVERGVIGDADRLIFTSNTTRRLYNEHYEPHAGKMETIYNSFDRLLYDEPEEADQHFDPAFLNLLFFGRFRRLSPARPFIDLLVKMRDKNEAAANHIRMHSFGPLSSSDQDYAREKGVFSQFNILDPIPPEKMLSVLPQADLLWLSTASERRTIIPAKLWDYLAAGRPIISIAPNPEIGEILEETGSGVQFQPNAYDALIDLLSRCVEAKLEGREELPVSFSGQADTLRRFEAKHTTRTLAKTFDELT